MKGLNECLNTIFHKLTIVKAAILLVRMNRVGYCPGREYFYRGIKNNCVLSLFFYIFELSF
jgi:hypothetical protein